MELQGVGEQVLPEHAELGGVAEHGGQRVVGDLRARLLRRHAEGAQGALDECLEVDLAALVVHPAHTGEGQQVVDEHLHAVGAVDGEGDVLVGALVELLAVAPLEELGEAGDLAQGLLEVVRGDVGELLQFGVGPPEVGRLLVELLPGAFGVGELRHQAPAHLLHVHAEAAQVGGTLGGDRPVEAALGDLPGRGGDPGQRSGHAPAQSLEDQRGDDEDAQRDRREHPVAQGDRPGEVLARGLTAVLEVGLLPVQGAAKRVEGPLPLVRALRGQGHRGPGGRGGHRVGDPPLPLIGEPLDVGEVLAGRLVVPDQRPEPAQRGLLVGDALVVGGEEVPLAREAVAADAGLLVDQGGLQPHRGDQRRGVGVHDLAGEVRGTGHAPGAESAEDGQHRQGRPDSDPQPAPGRPSGHRDTGPCRPLVPHAYRSLSRTPSLTCRVECTAGQLYRSDDNACCRRAPRPLTVTS